ncbi:hypothetical protein G9444_2514 [Rhodococcus erythropolis]|uniref:Uncharacterized protein n=1 Tax=Rhodococcus erythropolis TaxID=1833 RepID=A0A6G9CS95_RHOER|nr:phage minor capsid protein [Rhodococcus erythropolis]QIP39758.1 hypothetical protein G9444_2514 [Rhodococcus erythropolis]
MALDPSEAAGLPDELINLYTEAELALMSMLAEAIVAGIDTPEWEARQPAEMLRFRQQAQLLALQLQSQMPALVEGAVAGAAERGREAADEDLKGLPKAPPVPLATPARDRKTRAAIYAGQQVLSQVTARIPGAAGELHSQVTTQIIARSSGVRSGTRLDAAQQALDILTERGVRGFRDGAGRNWSLASYIEMKSRTIVNQELIDGHTDRMLERGQNLIVVSSHSNPAPQCQPYEGQVLSLDGEAGTVIRPNATGGRAVKVKIKATLREARSKGFQHPNAVLEGSTFATYGQPVEVVRSRYSGPAVTLSTGYGETTIGFNHPVMTVRGLIPAHDLKEGDQLVYDLRCVNGSGFPALDDNFNEIPLVEDAYKTLELASGYARIPSTRHDLHGDARFGEGEIEVVRPERGLLPVLDTSLDELLSQDAFMRSGVKDHVLSRLRSESATRERILVAATSGMGGNRVDGRHSFVTLPLERMSVKWWDGWAFDSTTELSLYCSDGLVVSNCGHAVSAFIPGGSRTFETRPDPAGYAASQKQRAMERAVRDTKRQQAVAVAPQRKRELVARLKQQQAAIAAHTEQHDLKRRPNRERLGAR